MANKENDIPFTMADQESLEVRTCVCVCVCVCVCCVCVLCVCVCCVCVCVYMCVCVRVRTYCAFVEYYVYTNTVHIPSV